MRFRQRLQEFDAYQLTQQAIDAHFLDKAPVPPGLHFSYSGGYEPRTRRIGQTRQHVLNRAGEALQVVPGDWIATDDDGSHFVVEDAELKAKFEPVT
jgi:hypothetical protein